MFGVGSRDRNVFGRSGTEGLVLLEARESREFITDFDHTMSSDYC